MTTIKLNIVALEHDQFLKLRCLMSHLLKTKASSNDNNEEIISEEFIVNNLATVRLHFSFKVPGLAIRVLALPINGKVKVRVSCQELDQPFYSEWICSDEWKDIGSRLYCDVSLANVITNLFNINISASNIDEKSPLVKLYDDDAFTDFKLSADGGTVPVHKALLAIHSDVFRAMLTREWQEKTEGSIQMEGVTLQTLKYFKDYMYLKALPDEGLKPLLLFASYYLMDDLMADCASKLTLDCKSKDWVGLLEFATKNQIFDLVSAVMFVNPIIGIETDKPDKQETTD